MGYNFLLLKERSEKNRPYMQISFELVRSTLACIVLRNVGTVPLEVKSLTFNETFTKQLQTKTQERLKERIDEYCDFSKSEMGYFI